jgi:hypothetical protein
MAHYITSAEFLQVIVNKSNGATLEVFKDLPNEYVAAIGRKDSPLVIKVTGNADKLYFYPQSQLPLNLANGGFEDYDYVVNRKGDQIESSWLDLAIDLGERFIREEFVYADIRKAAKVIEEGSYDAFAHWKHNNKRYLN